MHDLDEALHGCSSVRIAVCVLTTVALSIAAGAPASAKPRPPVFTNWAPGGCGL